MTALLVENSNQQSLVKGKKGSYALPKVPKS